MSDENEKQNEGIVLAPYDLDLGYLGEGVVKAEQITPLDQLKLAIIGPIKSGKSKLASTCRKPAFLADFDGRAASISGTPGLYVKTYLETNPLVGDAFQNFSTDIGMFEYQKSIGKDIPKTIICDSVTYMSMSAMNYVMGQSSAGTKEVKIGAFRLRLARGFEPYTGEVAFISNIFQRIIALGCDLIAVFHERPEETPDSTTENPKFTGKVTVHPPRALGYLALFNELWRTQIDEGAQGIEKYKIQTKPNYTFDAATALDGLEEIEKPDIQYLIDKHMMAFQNKQH